jgi:hypothetical protein
MRYLVLAPVVAFVAMLSFGSTWVSICGAAVATVGWAILPRAAKSMPFGAIKAGAVKPQDLVEEARVTVHVHPRRRGRRWRCWWHRGRRVCGWRW